MISGITHNPKRETQRDKIPKIVYTLQYINGNVTVCQKDGIFTGYKMDKEKRGGNLGPLETRKIRRDIKTVKSILKSEIFKK